MNLLLLVSIGKKIKLRGIGIKNRYDSSFALTSGRTELIVTITGTQRAKGTSQSHFSNTN